MWSYCPIWTAMKKEKPSLVRGAPTGIYWVRDSPSALVCRAIAKTACSGIFVRCKMRTTSGHLIIWWSFGLTNVMGYLCALRVFPIISSLQSLPCHAWFFNKSDNEIKTIEVIIYRTSMVFLYIYASSQTVIIRHNVEIWWTYQVFFANLAKMAHLKRDII